MTFEKQFYKIKMQLFNTNHKYLTKKVVINSIPTSLEDIGTCKVFIEFNIDDFIFDKKFATFLAKKQLEILGDFLIFLQLLICISFKLILTLQQTTRGTRSLRTVPVSAVTPIRPFRPWP